MGCKCDKHNFHYYNAYLKLRKHIFTVTSTPLRHKVHSMVTAHLSGKKKSVSSCSVISPCALSVCRGTWKLHWVSYFWGEIQKQRPSLIKRLRQDWVFWLHGLTFDEQETTETIFPRYIATHTDVHTRGTVAFQRMLKTNPDVATLKSPAFWWLSANRIVQKRWRNTPVTSFAGVAPAPLIP